MVTTGYLLFPTGKQKGEQEITLQKAIEDEKKKLVNIIFQRFICKNNAHINDINHSMIVCYKKEIKGLLEPAHSCYGLSLH